MSSVILVVRARHELTPELKDLLAEKFGDIEYIDVEPHTPEELEQQVSQHEAVAVLLRENPLPVLAMKRVPCIPLREGPLVRLKSIDPEVEPL